MSVVHIQMMQQVQKMMASKGASSQDQQGVRI